MKKSKKVFKAYEKPSRIHPVVKTMFVLLLGIIVAGIGMAFVMINNWAGFVLVITGLILVLGGIIIPKVKSDSDLHDQILEVSAFIFGLISVSIAIYISFFTASNIEFGVENVQKLMAAIFLLVFYIFGAALVYEAIKKLRSR
jgi:hypothetical protein